MTDYFIEVKHSCHDSYPIDFSQIKNYALGEWSHNTIRISLFHV